MSERLSQIRPFDSPSNVIEGQPRLIVLHLNLLALYVHDNRGNSVESFQDPLDIDGSERAEESRLRYSHFDHPVLLQPQELIDPTDHGFLNMASSIGRLSASSLT